MDLYKFTTTRGRATFVTDAKNKTFPLRNLYSVFSVKRKYILSFYYVIYLLGLEVPGISRFEQAHDFPLDDVSDLIGDQTKFALYDGTPSADSKRVWHLSKFGYVKIAKGSISRLLLENEYKGYMFHFEHGLERFLTINKRSSVCYEDDRLILQVKDDTSITSSSPSLKNFLSYLFALKNLSTRKKFSSKFLFFGLDLDLDKVYCLLKNRFGIDFQYDTMSDIMHHFHNYYIDFCPAHGDFAPWNMVSSCGVGEAKLIDLERFMEQELFGYDVLYFHVTNYAMFFRKYNIKKIYSKYIDDLSALDACDVYKSESYFRLLCLRMLFIRLNLAKNSIDFEQQDNFIKLVINLLKKDFSK